MAKTIPLYESLMQAIEARRARAGLSMVQLEELSGLSEGYFSKCLHASSAEGRRATLDTLQKIVDVLFDGVCVVKLLERHQSGIPAEANIKKINAAVRTYLRGHCIKIAPLGAAARNKKLTPAKRRALARRAIRTRWARHRERLEAERRATPASSKPRLGNGRHDDARTSPPL
jgi:hypothetical protein